MRRRDEDLCWELKEDYCETRRLFRDNRRLCEHIGFERPRDLDGEDEFDFDSSQDSSASDSSVSSEDYELNDSASSGDSESSLSEDASDTTLYATTQ